MPNKRYLESILFPEKLKIIKDYFDTRIRPVISRKRNISIFISIISIIIIMNIANQLLLYYIKSKYVNVNSIKSSIISIVRGNLKKAAQFGIVDFSLFQGVTFEDIKVSQEEDFSAGKIFFSSERIDIQLEDIFRGNTAIEAVRVYNARLNLDLNNISESQILSLFEKLPDVKIKIQNLELQLRIDSDLIFKSDRPIDIEIIKKNGEIIISSNDRLLGIPSTEKLTANGRVNLRENKFSLEIRLSNYLLEKFSGLIKKLSYLSPEEGELSGFLRISGEKNDFKLEGDLNLFKSEISLSGFNDITGKNISLNIKFSLFKEFQENGKFESYFNRKINSPAFLYDELVYTSPQGLRKFTISFLVEDLNKLISSWNLKDNFEVSGKLNLNLKLVETGLPSDWVEFNSVGVLERFRLKSKDPALNIFIDDFNYILGQKGEINARLNGKIFDKVLQGEISGNTRLEKSKWNEKEYFAFVSNLKSTISIDEFVIQEFEQGIQKIIKYVANSIKERQEKMLPESYLVLSPYFKLFAEKLNINLKLKLNKLKFRPESHSLGSFTLEGDATQGNFKLKGKGGMEDVSSMELNLLANTNQKVPFYDFRLSANSVPWMDETLNFCDSTFYSDWLDFNISMTASGNHFSDLVVTRYLNGGFRLGRSSAYRKRAYDPVRLDEFMGKGNINISGDFNAYSQEIYFRNLEVKGNGFSFLGYGNSTRNDQSFYFSGSNQNKYLSLNLNYNGEVCQKKK